MKRYKKIIAIASIAASLVCNKSSAFIGASELTGYAVVGEWAITGSYDSITHNMDSAFHGCEYDKPIVFDNRYVLKCKGYHYHYAYRPKAIVMYNGYSWKMIVDDEVYDMGLY